MGGPTPASNKALGAPDNPNTVNHPAASAPSPTTVAQPFTGLQEPGSPGAVAYNADLAAKLQASKLSQGQTPAQLQQQFNQSYKDAINSARISDDPAGFINNWAQNRFGISDFVSNYGLDASLYKPDQPTGKYFYSTIDSPTVTQSVDHIPKQFSVNLNESLGLSDVLNSQKQVKQTSQDLSTYQGGQQDYQNKINTLKQGIANYEGYIANLSKELGSQLNANPEAGGADTQAAKNLNQALIRLPKLQDELSQLERQGSLFSNLSTSTTSAAAKAKQVAQQSALSNIIGLGKTSPQVLPEAFAQQQGRHFDVNLSESLGVGDTSQKSSELLQGFGDKPQDPFGKPSEATAGFGEGSGFVSLSPSDLLGGNKNNINKINQDVTNLSNTPGLESITADFGNGNKKTYQPQQALGGILSDLTSIEKSASPGSNFGLNLVGNFAPVTVPLSPQQRQQQKQSFQVNQNNLLGSLATAKAKGITSLDITDQAGKVVGTTNPQDTTKARYDILKASLAGPVSVKGEVTTTSTSTTPGKVIDLSNMDYSQLVDIGAVAKPQTPLEYLNYYGQVFERPLKNPVEYIANIANQKINPKSEPLYNISPTTSDNIIGGIIQAGTKQLSDIGYYKAVGFKPDIDITTETRSPSTIFSEETGKGLQNIINDPFKSAFEVPGEIGQVIIGSKIGSLGLKGASALSTRIGERIASQSIKSAAERGLREGQLEFQVAKPKGKDIFEFEQGTAGKSGKVSDVIPQEFGIGPKGEKVPQLNIPEEIKIPNPVGEGQAKIPLAFINPENEGSVLIARSEPQDVLPPDRVLVKGVEPKLADILGLKPVQGQSDLYIGAATTENTPLIEGAVDTNKIKPVTDFFELYKKDFMKNPEVFGLFAREPKTLIPKNQNYAFQAFTRPNIIRYYEGFNGGFERSTGSSPLDRRVALNELYPRIRTATTGYIDLTSYNPKDFSIVGTGSKGLDRYLTDLGLSAAKRKRTFTSGKSNFPSGVSKELADRYPLMKSGITQNAQDMIRDIAYGYKPLPKGKATVKEETPLYPLPGLSEQTKEANRKATQREDQYFALEVLGYPPQHKQSGSFADLISLKKSSTESRTKQQQIGSEFSGIQSIEPLKDFNKSKSKSALDLILSLQPAQGIKSRQDITNKIIQDIIPVQGTKQSSTQTQKYGFDYKYETPQKQIQQNQFTDLITFKTPPQPPNITGQLPDFKWPDIQGLTSPGKKHGSRTRASFFGYTVNPNKPGDIADVNYASGKYVGSKPVKLRFSGSKLDSLLGTSAYSKRKSKKGLGLL